MKFLVDAQLPRRFATWLRDHGHDALHTLDLPEGNRTADFSIAALAGRETKDADFVDSHILRHQPEKLLLIATGNIANADLGGVLRRGHSLGSLRIRRTAGAGGPKTAPDGPRLATDHFAVRMQQPLLLPESRGAVPQVTSSSGIVWRGRGWRRLRAA